MNKNVDELCLKIKDTGAITSNLYLFLSVFILIKKWS